MPRVIFSECEPGCDCNNANSDVFDEETMEELFGSEPSDDDEDDEEGEEESPDDEDVEVANAVDQMVSNMNIDEVEVTMEVLNLSLYHESTMNDAELAHTLAWEQERDYIKNGLVPYLRYSE